MRIRPRRYPRARAMCAALLPDLRTDDRHRAGARRAVLRAGERHSPPTASPRTGGRWPAGRPHEARPFVGMAAVDEDYAPSRRGGSSVAITSRSSSPRADRRCADAARRLHRLVPGQRGEARHGPPSRSLPPRRRNAVAAAARGGAASSCTQAYYAATRLEIPSAARRLGDRSCIRCLDPRRTHREDGVERRKLLLVEEPGEAVVCSGEPGVLVERPIVRKGLLAELA